MATVVVTRHESDLGAWTHTEWKPAYGSPLFASVERIWHFDGALDAKWERVFPTGTLELIVIEAPSGHRRILGVRLTPPAAFSLLATSLRELTSCAIDLHDIVGDAAAVKRALDGIAARRHALNSCILTV